jgi:NDP-sugar pyrophosphorylase family protein
VQAADVQGQFMGLVQLTPAGLRRLLAAAAATPEPERARVDFTSLLRRLLDAGEAIGAQPCSGPWGEVDTPADLALYERLLDPAALGAVAMPEDETHA